MAQCFYLNAMIIIKSYFVPAGLVDSARTGNCKDFRNTSFLFLKVLHDWKNLTCSTVQLIVAVVVATAWNENIT